MNRIICHKKCPKPMTSLDLTYSVCIRQLFQKGMVTQTKKVKPVAFIQLDFICDTNYTANGYTKCKAKYSTKNIPKKFRKPLLPFETEASAESDILLYACHKKERLFFLISMAGVFLFCVLMNSSELIYRYLGSVKTKKVTDQLPWYYWWKNINYESAAFRNGASGFVVVFGFLVMGFGLAYPSRMIREITLLRGGEKILLETYRPFGFTKKREIKLKDISAQWGQKEAKDHLPLKIRGTRLHYLVDQEGIYFNRRLFDQTVGLHRF